MPDLSDLKHCDKWNCTDNDCMMRSIPRWYRWVTRLETLEEARKK